MSHVHGQQPDGNCYPKNRQVEGFSHVTARYSSFACLNIGRLFDGNLTRQYATGQMHDAKFRGARHRQHFGTSVRAGGCIASAGSGQS